MYIFALEWIDFIVQRIAQIQLSGICQIIIAAECSCHGIHFVKFFHWPFILEKYISFFFFLHWFGSCAAWVICLCTSDTLTFVMLSYHANSKVVHKEKQLKELSKTYVMSGKICVSSRCGWRSIYRRFYSTLYGQISTTSKVVAPHFHWYDTFSLKNVCQLLHQRKLNVGFIWY